MPKHAPQQKRPVPHQLLARARELRQTATDAETLMWKLLRNRQLGGAKFRRQHPIGPFILDFYCQQAKLAIELDGGGHTEPEQARYDAARSAALAGEGITVLRFWNNDVLKNTEGVLETILAAVGE
jgi:very-short-patch-repair endonuclease